MAFDPDKFLLENQAAPAITPEPPPVTPPASFDPDSFLQNTSTSLADDDNFDPIEDAAEGRDAADWDRIQNAFEVYKKRYEKGGDGFSLGKVAKAAQEGVAGVWSMIKGTGKLARNVKEVGQNYASDIYNAAKFQIGDEESRREALSAWDENEDDTRARVSEMIPAVVNGGKSVFIDLPAAIARNAVDLKNWATGDELSDDELRDRFDLITDLRATSRDLVNTGGIPGVTVGPEERAESAMQIPEGATPEQVEAIQKGRAAIEGEIRSGINDQTAAAATGAIPMSAFNNPVTRGAAGATLRVAGKGVESLGKVARKYGNLGTTWGVFSLEPSAIIGSIAAKKFIPATGKLLTEAGDSMFTGEAIKGSIVRRAAGATAQNVVTEGVVGAAFALGEDSLEEAIGSTIGEGISGAIELPGVDTGFSRGGEMSNRRAAFKADAAKAEKVGALRTFGETFQRSNPAHAQGMAALSPKERDSINYAQGFLAGRPNAEGKQIEITALPEAEFQATQEQLTGHTGRARGFVAADGNIYLNAGPVGEGGVGRTQRHETGHVAHRLAEMLGEGFAGSLQQSITSTLYNSKGQPTPEFKTFIAAYQKQLGRRVSQADAEAEFIAETTNKILEGKPLEEWAMKSTVGEKIRTGVSDAMKRLGLAPKSKDGVFDWTESVAVTGRMRDVLREIGKGSTERASQPIPEPAPAPTATPEAPAPAPSSPATAVSTPGDPLAPLGVDQAIVDAARDYHLEQFGGLKATRSNSRKGVTGESVDKKAERLGKEWDDMFAEYAAYLEENGLQADPATLHQDVVAFGLMSGSPAMATIAPEAVSATPATPETAKPRVRIFRDTDGQWKVRPESAPAAPEATSVDQSNAGAPAFISRSLRQQLYDLGYSKADVDSMKPEGAWAIVQKQETKTREPVGASIDPTLQPSNEQTTTATLEIDPSPTGGVTELEGAPSLTPATPEIGRDVPVLPTPEEVQGALAKAGVDPEKASLINDLQSRLGKHVYVDYQGADKPGIETGDDLDFSGKQRRKEYAESSATDRAKGRAPAYLQRNKSFIPLRPAISKTGKVSVLGFSLDKMLNNARAILDSAKAAKIETGYDKLKALELDEQLDQDFQAVAANHANGYKGDGSGPFKQFPDTGGVPANPDFAPIPIPRDRFNVINMAMHNDVAKKGKSRKAETRAKAVEAVNLARENEGFLTDEGEVNPLRFELTKSGLDLSTLESPFEYLKPELIEAVRDTPEGGQRTVRPAGFDIDPAATVSRGFPEGKKTSAGFMPDVDPEASSIKSKIGFMPEGKARKTKSEQLKERLEKEGYSFEIEDEGGVDVIVSVRDKDGVEVGGMTAYRYDHDFRNRYAEIGSVLVNPEHRGKGIAELMYREVGKIFQSDGFEDLHGEVMGVAPMNLREKVFGKFDYISDIYDELTKEEAKARLPETAAVDEDGNIGAGDRIFVRNKIGRKTRFMPDVSPDAANKPKIISTAIKVGDKIIRGKDWNSPHASFTADAVAEALEIGDDPEAFERGFVVSENGEERFVSRAEAGPIAKAAGQARERADLGNFQSQDLVQPGTSFMPEDDEKYPIAGDVVDGRTVINADDIPNQDSIDGEFENPVVLPGIREVPMSAFPGLNGRHYSVRGQEKIDSLAEQIKASNEITPLIVAEDAEGPWILEGATRADALYKLGAKSFPAIVVRDGSMGSSSIKSKFMPEAPDTPEFKKWFGKSKVVDKNGNPRRVFHGTEEGGFSEFKIPSFFSESRKEADAYTEITDTDGDTSLRYEPVGDREIPKMDPWGTWPIMDDYAGPANELAVNDSDNRYFYWDGTTSAYGDKNFVVLSGVEMGADGNPVYKETEDGDATEPRQLNRKTYEAYLSIENPIVLPWDEANLLGARLGADDADVTAKIENWKKQGHDGIETTSDEGELFLGKKIKQWIPFAPTQIKSATVNSGAFDASNPDIRFMPDKPDRMFTLGNLPRDMRETLYNEHATFVDNEATERDFYKKRVPSGWLPIEGVVVDKIRDKHLESYLKVRPGEEMPPVVIADGKLLDGQHRINAARKLGNTKVRYIDVSGLMDTSLEGGGYISELPKLMPELGPDHNLKEQKFYAGMTNPVIKSGLARKKGESIARHNAKVEVLEILDEAGLLTDDAIDSVEYWKDYNVEPLLMEAGDKRYISEIERDHEDDEEVNEWGASKTLFEWVEAAHAETDSIRIAGYVLPDGKKLSFSHDGRSRDQDHREVTWPGSAGGTEKMIAMMNAGAMRIDANSGNISIRRPPTGAQERAILEVADHAGTAYIDAEIPGENGWDEKAKKSFEVDEVNAEKALKQIRAFYRKANLMPPSSIKSKFDPDVEIKPKRRSMAIDVDLDEEDKEGPLSKLVP